MSPSPLISIITVNYNGGQVLKRCVDSILKEITADVELIVYDNASTDGSMDLLPNDSRISKVIGKENLGFAKGNNLASGMAKGSWYHFLNPDIIVNGNLNEDYKTAMDSNPNALFVTSLVSDDGSPQHMRMLIPTLGNYLNRLARPSKARYWSIGASIFLHRDTFRKLGGWSEAYFMYSEDLDLFYTAYQMGLDVVHMDTRLVHIGKVSSASRWSALQRAVVIEKSLQKFYRKHRSMAEYHIIRLIQLPYQLLSGSPEFGVSLKAYLKVNSGSA